MLSFIVAASIRFMELIKLRASQINGCAHCIDMHVKELRAMGEGEQRLYRPRRSFPALVAALVLLDAWKDSPVHRAGDRQPLARCGAAARIAEGGDPDEVYGGGRTQFSQQGLGILTHGIGASTGVNRLNIAF